MSNETAGVTTDGKPIGIVETWRVAHTGEVYGKGVDTATYKQQDDETWKLVDGTPTTGQEIAENEAAIREAEKAAAELAEAEELAAKEAAEALQAEEEAALLASSQAYAEAEQQLDAEAAVRADTGGYNPPDDAQALADAAVVQTTEPVDETGPSETSEAAPPADEQPEADDAPSEPETPAPDAA